MAFIVKTPFVQLVPLQPANVELESGVAVKATVVPLLKDAEHVLPQLIPDGLLVTVPLPVPLAVTLFTMLTVSAYF